MRLRVAAPARRDIASALAWSRRVFGDAAAERYRALIGRGLADIAAGTPFAVAHPGLGDGIRLYHLRHARGDPAHVRAPRHVLAFRVERDLVVVLRLLHEAMDLPTRLADS